MAGEVRKDYQVLIVASHRPNRAPNQRFRFEQYLTFLHENGVHCTLSYLIGEKEDKILYEPGKYWHKYQFLRYAKRVRKRDLRGIDQFDLVLVCREAMMTGSIFFEKAVHERGIPMVFDFDDSIWLMNVSKANRYFSFLKNPSKTRAIISLSNMVFAGNQYLSDYASQFSNNVRIVPTTIDTEEYTPLPKKDGNQIIIGWSGSITTIQHFEFAIPFLKEIKKKYGDRVEIKVIGDKNYVNEPLGIQGIAWAKETELKELREFDIGIMPLPDDEWAKGKCGLKGLQYMALEIPTIISPVGVNQEIIQHGKNGYLATSLHEWVDCISELIENREKRLSMGQEARKTVIERYSVEANKRKYLNYLKELLENGNKH